MADSAAHPAPESLSRDDLIRENAELRRQVDLLRATGELRDRKDEAFRFQSQVIDQIHDSVVATDLDGKITYWNNGAFRLFGFTSDEVIGQHISCVYFPEDIQFLENKVVLPLKTRGNHDIQVRMRRKNGQPFFAHLSLSLLRDQNGSPLGMIGYSSDITERIRMEQELQEFRQRLLDLVEARTTELVKTNEHLSKEVAERRRAEEALRESENRLSGLLSSINLIAVFLDVNGIITYGNDALLELTGWERHEIIGHNWFELFIPPDCTARLYDLYRSAFSATVFPPNHENEIVTREGERRLVRWSTTFVRNADDVVIGTASIGEEITVRRQKEQVVRWQADLLEQTHDAIYLYGLDGLISFWNHGAETTFGWSRTEAIGKNAAKLLQTVFPEDPEIVRNQLIRTGWWEGELLKTRRDGQRRHVASRCAIQYNTAGEPTTILEICNDITENKEAINALRESEERLRLSITAGNTGTWERDLVTGAITWSDITLAIYGLTRAQLPKSYEEFCTLVFPEDLAVIETNLQEAIRNQSDYEATYRIRRHDGTTRWVLSRGKCFFDNDGTPLKIMGILNDITERKRLEDEVAKAQKLESLGDLAGGIAHDFNNLLTAVLGNITLARHESELPDDAVTLLLEAEKGCLTAKGLTNQLLTFATGGAPIRKTSSITDLVRETALFVLRGSPIGCRLDIPDGLPPVAIDADQISQALHNVLINAVQSMPMQGTITIAMTATDTHPSGAPLPANYLRISITDQGSGIAPENLPRIFDPFFTTKDNGSGLGLASAFSIMNRHEGHIEVESEPGRGTTVHLSLPISEAPLYPAPPEEVRHNLPPKPARILIMDDDRKIRNVVEKFLSCVGYETATAVNGAEAIDLYRQAREAGPPFDAVIMDLTVPGGMGGKEALERLLAIDPAVKAIVSSGYSTDPVMANFREHGFQAVLAKPYQLKDLESVLGRVLAE